MSTPSQIAANRKNAQSSTGPTSETGKANSKLNALKTGLTGRTVLLPDDDLTAYTALVASFNARYQPVGDAESMLVQSLADTEWRLLRIPALEMNIYALGRLECAELFPNEEENIRKALIEAKIFLTYQRQLNNLSTQENRLRRQREKDVEALRELQQERARQTRKRLDEAAKLYIKAVHRKKHQEWEPENFGFEFSMAQVELRALEIEPDLFAEWAAQYGEAYLRGELDDAA